MAGLFDSLNNASLAGKLGLLSTGIGLLEGQSIGDSVKTGLSTYGGLKQIQDNQRQQQALEDLKKQYANNPNMLRLLSANPTGFLNAATQSAFSKSAGVSPQTKIAKIMQDLRNGLITKEQADSLIANETSTAPSKRDLYKTADGRYRFVDTGELVFPNVEPEIPSENRRYQKAGTYKDLETGEIIGEVSFDTQTGKYFTGDPNNPESFREIDMNNVRPVTDSYFNIGILNANQFRDLRSDIKDDKVSLNRLTGYLENIGDTNVGFDRIADQFTTAIKTLLGGEAQGLGLTTEELALKLASGELQGLLGRTRLETVGGGVMTEQDALRVISNLGGDVSALQNPEVVRAQIKRLFDDKIASYNLNVEDYNANLKERYSDLGYKPFDELDIDMSVFDSSSPKLTADTLTNMSYDKLIKLDDEDLVALPQDLYDIYYNRMLAGK